MPFTKPVRSLALKFKAFATLVAVLLLTSTSGAAPLESLPATDRPVRIGIYSGSFDPPHVGHSNSMKLALKKGLEYVVMIPNGRTAHKPGASPFETRLEMCQIVTDGDSQILVPTKVARQPEVIEDTMAAVRAKVPNAVFVGMIGSDVADLMSGKQPGYIAEQNRAWTDGIHEWYVKARVPNYTTAKKLLGKPAKVISGASDDISSTQIKSTAIHKFQMLKNLVGEKLALWLQTHPIYDDRKKTTKPAKPPPPEMRQADQEPPPPPPPARIAQ